MATGDSKGVTVEWKWYTLKYTNELRKKMRARMRTATSYLRAQVVASLSSPNNAGGTPSSPGQPPRAGTGHLRRSIFESDSETKTSISGYVGTTTIYGRILEYGGTITPKNVKNLAIPLTKQARKHNGSPKDFPIKLSFIPSKSGQHGFLASMQGKKVIRHYLLWPKAVYIAPRPYLRPALAASWPKIRKLLTK